MTIIEGQPGTWSHCGWREFHGPHEHTVVFTGEGPVNGVQCLGTPDYETLNVIEGSIKSSEVYLVKPDRLVVSLKGSLGTDGSIAEYRLGFNTTSMLELYRVLQNHIFTQAETNFKLFTERNESDS